MKKCLLGFIVLGLTSGCATTPPPKGICYTPTGVANQVNDMHKVFGISLGQPLDLPECEKDQRMHDAGYTDYGPCCTIPKQDSSLSGADFAQLTCCRTGIPNPVILLIAFTHASASPTCAL